MSYWSLIELCWYCSYIPSSSDCRCWPRGGACRTGRSSSSAGIARTSPLPPTVVVGLVVAHVVLVAHRALLVLLVHPLFLRLSLLASWWRMSYWSLIELCWYCSYIPSSSDCR